MILILIGRIFGTVEIIAPTKLLKYNYLSKDFKCWQIDNENFEIENSKKNED